MDYTRLYRKDGTQMKPMVVDSCFGGLAIYKTPGIAGCEYQYRNTTAPYMLDCEHVFFNQCIRQQNHGVVMSNPNM